MSPGVVCRSINGYANFEPLPGAALTSEEKLLVYIRPLGFMTELVEGAYRAHLVPDFQIRRRGQKAILREKKNLFEYKPSGPEPPRQLYFKLQVGLKGLSPGDYNLTVILHDEIANAVPATQVVKFRIVPPADAKKGEKSTQPEAESKGTDKPGQPGAKAQDNEKARRPEGQAKAKQRKGRARDELFLDLDGEYVPHFPDFEDELDPDF
jgi:hypothetical protein